MSLGSAGGIDASGNEQRVRGIGPHTRLFLPKGLLLFLLWAVLLSGCQRGTTDHAPVRQISGNHPPVVHAVTVHPVPLLLNGPVIAHVEAQDSDRNPLRFRYQWSLNGEPVFGQEGEQLPVNLLKRGDRVAVQVWPHDGSVEGASVISKPSVVGNSPPVGSALVLEPEHVFPGARVLARAQFSDVDGDLVHVTYRWWKNDKLIRDGDEAEVDTAGFVQGDTLFVEAVPSDGLGAGPTIRSSTIFIGNAPPQIVSVPAKVIANNRYDYQVEATDAESDAITFSLETAPSGMRIDERTGFVTWPVQPNQVGVHKVRILAKDSRGAASFQEFELNLTAGVAADPPGA